MDEDLRNRVEFSSKGDGYPSLFTDKFAVMKSDKSVMLMSVAAPQAVIKGIRALLACEKDEPYISGSPLHLIDPADGEVRTVNAKMSPSPHGYDLYSHRLEYGYAHALFVTKDRNLLLEGTDDELWRKLNGSNYTTPLLRHWIPWIKEDMIASGRIEIAASLNCQVSRLVCSNENLDEIVSRGVRDRFLTKHAAILRAS
jgi:hypothetical protein